MVNPMDHISLDEVLDLEDSYYKQGFQEGQTESVRSQFKEGKIYGLQTGFQRFLVVGYIEGMMSFWRSLDDSRITLHLAQLAEMVENIPTTNGDQEVEKYEKAVSRARNKIRVIATITKSNDRIAKLDSLLKEVGGSLQVSENMDEMW